MDLEEWELLPDDGYLEIHDDGGNEIFSRKYVADPKRVFQMNYFICPSPDFPKISDLIVPVPIESEQITAKAIDNEILKEFEVPTELSVAPSPITEKVKAPIYNIGAEETDQHTVSQVFFNQTKENEFVDMKMDSPKSSGFDAAGSTFLFEDATDAMKKIEATKMGLESDSKRGKQGLNIWKWSLNGIGAICSFGVAAATIYIVTFGSQQRNNKQQEKQNQKFRFQIYTDEKRMQQVVHHATKINEAMSAVRGVPLTTNARFTLGGYCDCI